MASASTLVQSSPTTRSWRQSLHNSLPQLAYGEAKYWASFKTEPPRRAVARLNPSQRGVRVFLALDPGGEPDLQPTPSTSTWAVQFPSVFQIASEPDLTRARHLILRSLAALKQSTSKRADLRPEYFAAEELPSEVEYVEGAACHVLVNAYERNRRAREACLRHYELCRLWFHLRGQLSQSSGRIHSSATCNPNSTGRGGVPSAPDPGLTASMPQLPCRNPSSRATILNRGNQADAAKRRCEKLTRR